MVVHSAFKVTCAGTPESTTFPVQKVGTAHPTTGPRIRPPRADWDSSLFNQHQSQSHLLAHHLSGLQVAPSSSPTHSNCSSMSKHLILLPMVGLFTNIWTQTASSTYQHSLLHSTLFIILQHYTLPHLASRALPRIFCISLQCILCILFIGHQSI